MRGPSKKAIWSWFQRLNDKTKGYHRPTVLTEKDASRLKKAIQAADDPESVDAALDLANRLTDMHGVESLQASNAHVDRYYFNIVGLYVNTGETYDETLLYETEDERFLLTSYGAWIEWAEEKRRPRYLFE